MHSSLLALVALGTFTLSSGIALGEDLGEESEASEPPGAVPRASQAEQASPASQADQVQRSISCGAANRGSLHGPAEMPRQGAGFEIPEPWWSRGHHYGTDELVGLIVRAAAVVEATHPGARLGVADLSGQSGGALPGHRSHQSGRDADIIFYALDPQGNPFRPDEHMAYYTHTGRAYYAKAPRWARGIPERYFDLARNWALVKAMISDHEAQVEHIFVSSRVRRWLLDYARQAGEPEELVRRASSILKRATATGGHNDHMHVRIACSADDMALGRCRNGNAQKRGRRKFYSHVRCPITQPVAWLTGEAAEEGPEATPHGSFSGSEKRVEHEESGVAGLPVLGIFAHEAKDAHLGLAVRGDEERGAAASRPESGLHIIISDDHERDAIE